MALPLSSTFIRGIWVCVLDKYSGIMVSIKDNTWTPVSQCPCLNPASRVMHYLSAGNTKLAMDLWSRCPVSIDLDFSRSYALKSYRPFYFTGLLKQMCTHYEQNGLRSLLRSLCIIHNRKTSTNTIYSLFVFWHSSSDNNWMNLFGHTPRI